MKHPIVWISGIFATIVTFPTFPSNNFHVGITSFFEDDVGIGTASPDQKLDVAGNIIIDTGSNITLDSTTDTVQLFNDGTSWIATQLI